MSSMLVTVVVVVVVVVVFVDDALIFCFLLQLYPLPVGLLLSKEVRASLGHFVQNFVCGRIRANYIKQNKMHLDDYSIIILAF